MPTLLCVKCINRAEIKADIPTDEVFIDKAYDLVPAGWAFMGNDLAHRCCPDCHDKLQSTYRFSAAINMNTEERETANTHLVNDVQKIASLVSYWAVQVDQSLGRLTQTDDRAKEVIGAIRGISMRMVEECEKLSFDASSLAALGEELRPHFAVVLDRARSNCPPHIKQFRGLKWSLYRIIREKAGENLARILNWTVQLGAPTGEPFRAGSPAN